MASPRSQRDNQLYGNTFILRKMNEMNRFQTAHEYEAYLEGLRDGVEAERNACLDDCFRVYERIDGGEPALAVQSCIEEIQERAKKENT